MFSFNSNFVISSSINSLKSFGKAFTFKDFNLTTNLPPALIPAAAPTNFKGKVIGFSLKDRGAILPAGHFANWAFWYSNTGSFISSSFYGNKLPDWTIQFNEEKNYIKYIEKMGTG